MRLRLGFDQFRRLFQKLFEKFGCLQSEKTTTRIVMCAEDQKRAQTHLMCARLQSHLPILRLPKQKLIIACSTPPPFPKQAWKDHMSEKQKQNHNNIITCEERQSHRKNPVTLYTCASRLHALHLLKPKWLNMMFLPSFPPWNSKYPSICQYRQRMFLKPQQWLRMCDSKCQQSPPMGRRLEEHDNMVQNTKS